jgi:hypothetical protein
MNKPRKPPSPAQLVPLVALALDVHPVGSAVNYWPGIMDESLPPRAGETSTAAQVLGGHTAGVYVDPGGFIALDHVKVAS